MSTGLLVAAVLVAAAACPAMMWFQGRRGKRVPCCPPDRQADQRDIAELRAEHARLTAELEAAEREGARALPLGSSSAVTL